MTNNQILYSGITVPCKFRSGEEVAVRLRLIRISEIPAYLDVAIEEAAAVAFCLEEPHFDAPAKGEKANPHALAFLDSLTDESYLELVARNTDLNFSRALAMSDQRLKQAEKTGAGVAQIAANLASLLSRYSPSSPSPAATPANNSSA